tara:strand:+ start:216 stop:626 length:411 start_codon:yes stop_codon:yes gene_type:complete
MERKEFVETLLDIAFASMVCDGDIAPEEEEYLRDIEKSDFYLKEFDMSDKLDKLTSDWELHGLILCERILNSAYKNEFSEDQKIVTMDFAIGIVRADGIMRQSEIQFINSLMRNIKVSTELVEMRYGNWSIIDTGN